MNILLGDISSYKAIAVAKFIRSNYPQARIYGFDYKNFTKKIHSKYFHKNFVCLNDDIDEFIELIESNQIDLFIPVINKKLSEFWEQKDKFGSTLGYLGTYESYEILNNKILLHELADSLGVKVPKKYDSINEGIMPFVVKPTNLSSAEGVIYVNGKDDLRKIDKLENIIIQQFVEGTGVGYSFYCKEGKILNGHGHKRLAEYPISGGSSTYRTNYEDIRMIEAAEVIVKNLKYTGFAMFEFKLTAENELYLLEVNPRIWGSINQGLINGTNYFENILGKAEGKNQINTKGTNSYLSPHIYLTLFLYAMTFNFKPLKVFLKNLFHNKSDVSMVGDPLGYLSTLLRKIL